MRRHLTPSLVISVMALFVALGAVIAEVSLSGAISLDPGEYVFRVLCKQNSGAGSTATPYYDRGDLTVIATGI